MPHGTVTYYLPAALKCTDPLAPGPLDDSRAITSTPLLDAYLRSTISRRSGTCSPMKPWHPIAFDRSGMGTHRVCFCHAN